VLGESLNSGWEATGPGGRSLGAPQLIDGYANGWYVTPPSASFIVTLRFGPQQSVVPAIVASGTTLFLCLVVGFVPFGPIRRRLRRGRAHTAAAADSASATTPGAPAIAKGAPTLYGPFADRTGPPNVVICCLVAALCGGVGLVVLPPPSAPFVAGAIVLSALASLRVSLARPLLSLLALGCILAAGTLAVLGEIAHHYPAGSSWPHNFESAGVLAFVGVVALACDAAVAVVRRRDEPNEDRPL
jgi:hypothetical protein